jgi:hypothetical protein
MQKAYMLTVVSDEELGDLIEWLREHPDDGDIEADGLDAAALRVRLDRMLRDIQTHAPSFPFFTPVPLDLVPLLQWAMEDWAEILESHDDSLKSDLMMVEH